MVIYPKLYQDARSAKHKILITSVDSTYIEIVKHVDVTYRWDIA